MSTPSTFTIPLTPGEYTAARARLAAQFSGAYMPEANRGVVNQQGVKLEFSYNGTDTLTFTVDHKPLLYPEGRIEAAIRGWLAVPAEPAPEPNQE